MRYAPLLLALPLAALGQKKPEELLAALNPADVKKGVAFHTEGPRVFFAVESEKEPLLRIDDEPAGRMDKLPGGNVWTYSTELRQGTSHSFHYMIEGKRFGGRQDVPVYLSDCYLKPGAREGTLSAKLTHTSKIYEGMTTDYWIYVPAEYDASRAAALMVWQDGERHINRGGVNKTLNVLDNLTHQKRIPVMISVFINPGVRGQQRMRSVQYDTVDDTYPRFLRDEILAEVQARYNIRRDAYSRGIEGQSSGAICALNAAWQHNDQFSRVLSHIGSYTSIQWRPGQLEGGNVYPFKVRKEPKRNIRIWIQDGSEDLENQHGSWPLQNIQLANSLKMRGYDFRLSWSNGSHNSAHGSAELPRSLSWLWRDYDPARTEQIYEQDPAEKEKPLFRVSALNRE
jgi:enterochelin esterase-like enzyme